METTVDDNDDEKNDEEPSLTTTASMPLITKAVESTYERATRGATYTPQTCPDGVYKDDPVRIDLCLLLPM